MPGESLRRNWPPEKGVGGGVEDITTDGRSYQMDRSVENQGPL